MIVVVLSVCPEKLRGELTRWLLEVNAGVYVGHLPARARDLLWLRIVEDVGRGRALMVHSTRGEQRLSFKVHNHAWAPVDLDGLTLMRRTTADSRALATAAGKSRQKAISGQRVVPPDIDSESADGDDPQNAGDPARRRNDWSHAARRRRYKNAVERRRDE
jgi:CRISPR-associated protein Cas2